MKKYPFRKAKNAFIYDLKSNKFYDFRDNSNIIGHSHKNLTTIVKNNISSSWNITGNSIYHERMRKLFQKEFGKDFVSAISFSLEEFFLRFFNYYQNIDGTGIELFGERFKLWLNEKNIIPIKNKDSNQNIYVYDVAEIYLKSRGNLDLFENEVNNIKKKGILVLNYYWFPDLKIITSDADIIILPKIYNGNFNYVNILIKKEIKNYLNFTNELDQIPSLYVSSSLKNYYLINRLSEKSKILSLNWIDFIQSNRLFSLENTDQVKEKSDLLESKNIIINNKPPFYSYIPIILEEYQEKYLKKVF